MADYKSDPRYAEFRGLVAETMDDILSERDESAGKKKTKSKEKPELEEKNIFDRLFGPAD